MNSNTYNEMDDELRPDYDLSQLKGGVRGKYVQRYKEGTNLILLAPDVAIEYTLTENEHTGIIGFLFKSYRQ